MSAPVPASPAGAQRRVPRCPLAVPVRVTVVRSGIPNAIPGRSLDLSEGGIAAILGGDLLPGDPVAVEFLLPQMGLGLHAKAIVRHRTPLRCGLAFQTLSVEQRAIIRRWTHRALGANPSANPSGPAPVPSKSSARSVRNLSAKFSLRPLRRAGGLLMWAAIGVALVLGVFWWRWQEGWGDLRAQTAQPYSAKAQRVTLPPGVMEPLLVYKQDPILPDGVRKGTGAVLLSVVIGRDGTVIDQHPTGGNDALSRAAMDAVRSWRFQPYRVKGEAVEVETTLAVGFREK
jgi:TonB family protein